jgi:hypothetical protein
VADGSGDRRPGGLDVSAVPDLLVGARYSDHAGDFSGSARVFSGASLSLVGDEHLLSIAAGGTQALALDAGPANGGAVYWMFGSASGTSPGTPLGGAVLPLAFDAYFALTLKNPFLGAFSGFVGLLDASGGATAVFQLPPAVDRGWRACRSTTRSSPRARSARRTSRASPLPSRWFPERAG